MARAWPLILVDTSVWVDHLCSGDLQPAALLERSRVGVNPMVLGELACGNLTERGTLLRLRGHLPQLPAATARETLFFLERNHRRRRGRGYADIHLLASVSVNAGGELRTRDEQLLEATRRPELPVAAPDA